MYVQTTGGVRTTDGTMTITVNALTLQDIDGYLCSVFICAQCREPIQGLGAGLIQWDSFDEPTAFTVLHKGPGMPCSAQWEREHGKTWRQWRPLEKFVDQLQYNTRYPFGQESA